MLSQSHRNIEVILVNDGSTDNSDAIIKRYLPVFYNNGIDFKYFKQDNAGAAAAVDLALQYVTGKYIILYDTDDVLYRDAVYEKVKFLEENHEFSMVVNNGYYVNQPFSFGKNFFYYKAPNGDRFFDGLIDGKYNNWPGSYMIRADEFRERISQDGHIYTSQFGQNLQFMLPMAYRSRVGYIEKPLMNYYVRPTSHSHYGGKERTIERSNGYKMNRIETLKTMRMDNADREKYINRIENNYNLEGKRIHKSKHNKVISFLSRAFNRIYREIKGKMIERKLSKIYGMRY